MGAQVHDFAPPLWELLHVPKQKIILSGIKIILSGIKVLPPPKVVWVDQHVNCSITMIITTCEAAEFQYRSTKYRV